MEMVDLVFECMKAMKESDPAFITLVIPRGKPVPRKGWPRMELLSENEAGDRVYRVSAERIMARLVKAGLVELKSMEGTGD